MVIKVVSDAVIQEVERDPNMIRSESDLAVALPALERERIIAVSESSRAILTLINLKSH
jgi:hypothetical protein